MKRISKGAVIVCFALASCSSDDGDPSAAGGASGPVADLRADANRDGVVRFDDDSDAEKTTWSAKTGAVFLANIDDDLEQCKKTGSDVDLPKCNDAANDVIDGADDLLDLARMKTRAWPAAPDGATATIEIVEGNADYIRLFKRTGSDVAATAEDFAVYAPGEPLTADDLRQGIELGIEATDIVRDSTIWDGYVVIQYTVTAGDKSASDRVRLRVAPVLTSHHLLPVEKVYVSNTGDRPNALLRDDVETACKAAGVARPTELAIFDQWTQDLFESGTMSMPAEGGAQHVMRVVYRSPGIDDPEDAKNPLRATSKVAFTHLRGKDVAAIQQFDPKHSLEMVSLNSLGNLETIPPYALGDESYPFGRMLVGKTKTFFPDPTFVKMLEAQSQQPPVYIDTSWLYVGHVDETVSFVKANTPRGWVLVANDPTLAKKILEDAVEKGQADTPMFLGLSWYDEAGEATPAQTTIAGVLANTDVMQASAKAAVSIDGQLAKVKAETGITDAEIVRLPFLHMTAQGLAIAYQPATVNGLYIAEGHFVAPDPHGPEIGGKDIFREQMIQAFAPFGITVHFAEDWDGYHTLEGEVHCGTNTMRHAPDAKWWESGR